MKLTRSVRFTIKWVTETVDDLSTKKIILKHDLDYTAGVIAALTIIIDSNEDFEKENEDLKELSKKLRTIEVKY